MAKDIQAADQKTIERLVSYYSDAKQQSKLTSLHDSLRVQLAADAALKDLVHSMKGRIKDPAHLRDKLERKSREAAKKGKLLTITEQTLFARINDLVGIRIIHLHTTQFAAIRVALKNLFAEQEYQLIEDFEARTWDDESREYFESISIAHKPSATMYSSVHCVIATNPKLGMTAEFQIRTLSDELWGEVDHKINYPHPTPTITCREQIKVLARLTSGATRLVDAIFSAHERDALNRDSSSKKPTSSDARRASSPIRRMPKR